MTDRRDIRPSPGGPGEEEDLLGPELRSLLSSLPRGIAPDRDLSGEIAAQTWDSGVSPGRVAGGEEQEAGERARRARKVAWSSGQGWLLAAAAAILVVVTSTLTVVVMRLGDGGSRTIATGDAPPAASAVGFASAGLAEDLRAVAEDYEQAVADLRAVLEANRDVLGEATMQIVEENLAVLDLALRETVEALQSAPADPQLRGTMVTTYERKLDFLRQAVALTAEI